MSVSLTVVPTSGCSVSSATAEALTTTSVATAPGTSVAFAVDVAPPTTADALLDRDLKSRFLYPDVVRARDEVGDVERSCGGRRSRPRDVRIDVRNLYARALNGRATLVGDRAIDTAERLSV